MLAELLIQFSSLTLFPTVSERLHVFHLINDVVTLCSLLPLPLPLPLRSRQQRVSTGGFCLRHQKEAVCVLGLEVVTPGVRLKCFLVCLKTLLFAFSFSVCFFPTHCSVRAGVDHFKHGRHVEAMNEYNKALEIDTCNVEALVARGAL